MKNSLFIAVDDLLGEGVNEVLARVQGYGVSGLAVACAYHEARDVTPHGATRVTVRHDGLYFAPTPAMFSVDGLRPDVVPGVGGGLASVLRAAKERGIGVAGWTVFLHNSTFGVTHPGVMQENCFGDRGGPADLCPASPAVRLYATELACAVADQGISTIIAESLHYGLFGHGYHHERSFVQLDAVDRFLLGVCFCVNCMRYVTALGVDAATARIRACAVLEQRLSGGPASSSELSLAALGAAAGGEIVEYLQARRGVVTSLVEEVAGALTQRSARLVFLDMMGAEQGYGDGLMRGAAGVDLLWQLGIEPAEISRHADYGILGYARDPERVRLETRAYRAVLDEGSSLRVVLRLGMPDCDSSDNLRAKVDAATAEGASSVDFYHYGLYPFTVLERLSEVIGISNRSHLSQRW
jgi:hypothetical protein